LGIEIRRNEKEAVDTYSIIGSSINNETRSVRILSWFEISVTAAKTSNTT